MSIRLVSTEQIRFDVDAESYNRMLKYLLQEFQSTMVQQIEATISSILSNSVRNSLIEKIMEDFDYSSIEYNLSQHVDYSRVVDYIKQGVADLLRVDARFNTLITRGINAATIGVIEETVELVTARMLENQNKQGDI
jgi:hypothetical protein